MPQMWPMQWELIFLSSLLLLWVMMNKLFLFTSTKKVTSVTNTTKKTSKPMPW